MRIISTVQIFTQVSILTGSMDASEFSGTLSGDFSVSGTLSTLLDWLTLLSMSGGSVPKSGMRSFISPLDPDISFGSEDPFGGFVTFAKVSLLLSDAPLLSFLWPDLSSVELETLLDL